MLMTSLTIACALLALLVLTVALHERVRDRLLLARWARSCGLELLEVTDTDDPGPFPVYTYSPARRSPLVFRVRVRVPGSERVREGLASVTILDWAAPGVELRWQAAERCV